MILSLVSAAGAPGVTTTSLALALAWPRRCLLLESDVTGASAVLAGFWQGRRPHDRGLMTLALAQRSGDLAAGLDAAVMPLSDDGRAHIVPALSAAGQGSTAERLWPVLARVLRERPPDQDVLVDAGRLGTRHGPDPLIEASNRVLLVVRSNLPSIAAARAGVERLSGLMRDPATELGVLVIGDRRPYSAGEIASVLGVPVAGTLAWDPKGAAALSDGRPVRRPSSTALMTAAQRLAFTLAPSPPPTVAPAGPSVPTGERTPVRPTPTSSPATGSVATGSQEAS